MWHGLPSLKQQWKSTSTFFWMREKKKLCPKLFHQPPKFPFLVIAKTKYVIFIGYNHRIFIKSTQILRILLRITYFVRTLQENGKWIMDGVDGRNLGQMKRKLITI
jgi:hypothetical protein